MSLKISMSLKTWSGKKSFFLKNVKELPTPPSAGTHTQQSLRSFIPPTPRNGGLAASPLLARFARCVYALTPGAATLACSSMTDAVVTKPKPALPSLVVTAPLSTMNRY